MLMYLHSFSNHFGLVNHSISSFFNCLAVIPQKKMHRALLYSVYQCTQTYFQTILIYLVQHFIIVFQLLSSYPSGIRHIGLLGRIYNIRLRRKNTYYWYWHYDIVVHITKNQIVLCEIMYIYYVWLCLKVLKARTTTRQQVGTM